MINQSYLVWERQANTCSANEEVTQRVRKTCISGSNIAAAEFQLPGSVGFEDFSLTITITIQRLLVRRHTRTPSRLSILIRAEWNGTMILTGYLWSTLYMPALNSCIKVIGPALHAVGMLDIKPTVAASSISKVVCRPFGKRAQPPPLQRTKQAHVTCFRSIADPYEVLLSSAGHLTPTYLPT